ncbi:MAG: isomerizing glutamine--fructose-6-phosphate transaminase, partial [Anaerolineae bacterium]|nr:isomerizing glutamine--fructose-6-phosphate transaminase [Anaerolineae bacterium]
MCGIVGYVGPRAATPIIVEGLKRLEYRGYDSAGLAVIQDGRIEVRRDVGKLANLEKMLAESPLGFGTLRTQPKGFGTPFDELRTPLRTQPKGGNIGIGHTRWATHGAPSPRNAHPHVGCRGEVVVIHNGIVENFLPLRQELTAEGHRFTSETDTETIVHLVEKYLTEGSDLEGAVRRALGRIKGAHAVVVMSSRQPDRIVAARLGNAGGVVVGIGEGEMFVASDVLAILEYTRQVIFLEDRQMAVITQEGARFTTLNGQLVVKEVHTVPWDPVSAAKGEYKHFMQKEIYEQAHSITDTIRGRVDFEAGQVCLDEINISPEEAQAIERMFIVACGTSAYSALVGKFIIETLARIPVEVDYGSEFRYRDPLINERTVVLAITQSGETVDTLAAMEEARSKGAKLLSIVNVMGS